MDIGELDGWVAESRDSPTSLISKMFLMFLVRISWSNKVHYSQAAATIININWLWVKVLTSWLNVNISQITIYGGVKFLVANSRKNGS